MPSKERQPGTAASAAGEDRARLAVVLAITVAVLVADVVGMFVAHSLALLADAGHMATDASGIGLSLLAVWLGGRPASGDRTFGSYRLEILAAVANAVLLFGVGGYVLAEAVHRLVSPPAVSGGPMVVFALIGLAGNTVSLLLLWRAQARSLTARSAFLEVLGDLLGAAGVLLAAVVIVTTGFRRADPVASLLIGALIVPRTWKLLRAAVDVLLEATPRGVDMAAVRRHILEVPGVVDCHDLHAWTITSGMNVLSAHVVVADGVDGPPVLDRLGECLAHHFDIEHSTFQLEPSTHLEHERSMHP